MTDPQDPLPESDFKWRRLYTFALTTLITAAVGFILWKLAQIGAADQLAKLAFWLLLLLWWVVTFYMIAPSAEQIARIIQSARVQRTVAEQAPAVVAAAAPTPPQPDREMV